MVGSLGITCFGSVHHALGVASLTSGRTDAAVDHLRAAVRRNLALAHWPAVVASRRRLAQAYRLRGQPGDADAARAELETAIGEAAALGLPALDTPTVGPSGTVAECRRIGRKWRLAWQDRSVLIEDSIGMAHLAVLLANPRQEIPAADLAAGLAALTAAGDRGSAYPVLDQAALAEYRHRLRRLDAGRVCATAIPTTGTISAGVATLTVPRSPASLARDFTTALVSTRWVRHSDE